MWVVYHNNSPNEEEHQAFIFPDQGTAEAFITSRPWEGEVYMTDAGEITPSRISPEWGFCVYCSAPLDYHAENTHVVLIPPDETEGYSYHSHDSCWAARNPSE